MNDQAEAGRADAYLANEDVLARLEEIQAGFRQEQIARDAEVLSRAHAIRRSTRTGVVVAIAVALVLSWFTIDSRGDNVELARRAQVDRERSVQVDYDRKANLHDACVRQSDGRVRNKAVLIRIIDLATTQPMERTPEEQAGIDALVRKLKLEVEAELPPIDCDVESPMPKGPRPKVST